MGYIGPLEHLYIVKYRLDTLQRALQSTILAARDSYRPLLSSYIGIQGPWTAIAAILTLQTRQPATTTTALKQPLYHQQPQYGLDRLQGSLDHPSKQLPQYSNNKSNQLYGSLVVVVAMWQWSTRQQQQERLEEYLSLKVYFSLGLLEVQWRHDFYLEQNFQSRKRAMSRSHQ